MVNSFDGDHHSLLTTHMTLPELSTLKTGDKPTTHYSPLT